MEGSPDSPALSSSFSSSSPLSSNEQIEHTQRILRHTKHTDYYAVLQVDRSANDAEIRKRYRSLALLLHPDKANSNERSDAEEAFKILQSSYDVLKDPFKRRIYDIGGERAFDSGFDWSQYWTQGDFSAHSGGSDVGSMARFGSVIYLLSLLAAVVWDICGPLITILFYLIVALIRRVGPPIVLCVSIVVACIANSISSGLFLPGFVIGAILAMSWDVLPDFAQESSTRARRLRWPAFLFSAIFSVVVILIFGHWTFGWLTVTFATGCVIYMYGDYVTALLMLGLALISSRVTPSKLLVRGLVISCLVFCMSGSMTKLSISLLLSFILPFLTMGATFIIKQAAEGQQEESAASAASTATTTTPDSESTTTTNTEPISSSFEAETTSPPHEYFQQQHQQYHRHRRQQDSRRR